MKFFFIFRPKFIFDFRQLHSENAESFEILVHQKAIKRAHPGIIEYALKIIMLFYFCIIPEPTSIIENHGTASLRKPRRKQ